MPEFFALLPSADDIEKWARYDRSAEDGLAELIQMLVVHTAAPTRVDIPIGKAINQPGVDGLIESPGNAWVPSGSSVWEWGVPDPDDKGNSDYKDRTEATDPEIRSRSTFVFVTPWKWTRSRTWAATKRGLGDWLDVKVLDSSDLVAWLRADVASHLWLAERIDGPRSGDVRTLASVWQEWADAFYPPKSATFEVVLAGRAAEAAVVRTWIGSPGRHFFRAESPDEGAAFVAAALSTSELHAGAISQAVVVESNGTWLRLVSLPRQPMVLIPFFDGPTIKPAIENGHTVIMPIDIDSPGEFEFTLSRAKEKDLVPALIAMEVEPERAGRLAKESGGSMIALRRHLSANAPEPSWAKAGVARFLAPAAMAGRWDEAVEGDREILARLAAMDYVSLQTGLAGLTDGADPPVRLVGTVWSVPAQLDALRHLSREIPPAGWNALEAEALAVLGSPDPASELPAEERWMANLKGKGRPHSEGLRRGIAEALAIVATQPDFEHLPGARVGSSMVSRVVMRLLREANDDPTGQKWADLEDQLPLLAEAAPNTFVEEVQHGLEGVDPLLAQLLVEEPGMIMPRSRVTGLLWALERLAWSTDYLSAAAVILARLAALDPGGSRANRPFNSLVEILLPWHPQTQADGPGRVAALEAAHRAAPEAAWPLLLRLLPKMNDIGGMTAKPEWRPWALPADENNVPADYPDFIHAVLRLLLSDVGSSAPRWKDLVGAYDDLPPAFGDEVLAALDRVDPASLAPADLEILSDAMRESVSNHRTYADAKWALPEDRVAKLEAVARKFAPADPVLDLLWLFDMHPSTQRVSGRYQNYEGRLLELRTEAVARIFKDRGWVGVEDLVGSAKASYAVGFPILGLSADAQAAILLWAGSSDTAKVQALHGYLSARNRRDGWAWTEGLIRGLVGDVSEERLAKLLLAASRGPDAWRLAAELGGEIERTYWQAFDGFPGGDDQWLAARKLIEFGRPFGAIQVIGANLTVHRGPFEPEVAFEALDAAARMQVSPLPHDVAGVDHEVTEIIKALDASGFDVLRLANIEWVFLRLLERQPDALKHIHRRLADEAAFFVEVTTLVFRAKDEEAPTVIDPELQRFAQQAFALLHSWHGPIPGGRQDGSIDADALNAWVDASRASLDELGRAEIGDQRIGHALWYAPVGADGFHPHEAVRDVIERVGSQEMEVGFSVEAFNSRGTVWRGHGGDQERELAARYAELAKLYRARWPRTAGVFRGIEERYVELGHFEDIREAQD